MLTVEEHKLLDAIVARAKLLYDAWYPSFLDAEATRAMIVKAHAVVPGGFDFAGWLALKHDNPFLYDILGLRHNFDTATGEMFRGFRPRNARGAQ